MQNKDEAVEWFKNLRDLFCNEFEKIEEEYNSIGSKFTKKPWTREGGGGGEISVMRGKVFEKVGVNISTVFGELSPNFRGQIPGTEEDPRFFATGISIVAHMSSPLIPAAHFNTRFIQTSKNWFGGGADMTPTFIIDEETEMFHKAFQEKCDLYDKGYYPKFKKECDEYFYLPHRAEPRGIGGIFYDYLNSGDLQKDFSFTQDVGRAFLEVFPKIIRKNLLTPWTEEQKNQQLIKRGRYVEFNLLQDRGTKFGLMTGGNIEAIFMSLPPVAAW